MKIRFLVIRNHRVSIVQVDQAYDNDYNLPSTSSIDVDGGLVDSGNGLIPR